jgi:hypothetical protein
MTEAWLLGRLRALWKIRNSAIRVDSERLALYADRLGRYGFPEGAVAAALDQLEREDGDFFPSLGHIMAAIRDNLQRAGFLEAPDAAWARACREAGRYVPVVRPAPTYSSPAIAKCVARLGGPTAFLADDDTAPPSATPATGWRPARRRHRGRGRSASRPRRTTAARAASQRKGTSRDADRAGPSGAGARGARHHRPGL